jgi:predicted GNAT family acetyltransferase
MTGSYKNNCRYIAVMANIGAEYNYKTGKHTLIRIEPYIQIPLKGIGIGSMPVMTAGLHVGFMRFTP